MYLKIRIIGKRCFCVKYSSWGDIPIDELLIESWKLLVRLVLCVN